ncbi:hypothetical protein T484DRAFT_2852075 [Baffinella frigidus]|nr:hypothetical protein T484DRAFT_2852075 [Cryptophyta sp. CCMP2293]
MNARRVVRSIIRQLRAAFGKKVADLPHEMAELRAILEDLLMMARQQELIAITIDAVDNLESDLGVLPNFEWLPRLLPPFSSIMCSLTTSAQTTLNVLNTMFTGEVYYRIGALKPIQAAPILEKYLAQSQRQGFQAEHYEAIRLAAPQSANLTGTPLNLSPLFMALAWRISDDWLSFEPAPKLPTDVNALALWYVTDLETRHGSMLVMRALGYLHFARDGLTWFELADMLSCDDDALDEVYGVTVPDFRRLPAFQGKVLLSDLDALLDLRRTQLQPVLAHRHQIYRSVCAEHFKLEEKAQQHHRALAYYFAGVWADGKEIWKDWEPLSQIKGRLRPGEEAPAVELYPRGINAQPVLFSGHAKGIFHRRHKVRPRLFSSSSASSLSSSSYYYS